LKTRDQPINRYRCRRNEWVLNRDVVGKKGLETRHAKRGKVLLDESQGCSGGGGGGGWGARSPLEQQNYPSGRCRASPGSTEGKYRNGARSKNLGSLFPGGKGGGKAILGFRSGNLVALKVGPKNHRTKAQCLKNRYGPRATVDWTNSKDRGRGGSHTLGQKKGFWAFQNHMSKEVGWKKI